MHWWQLPFSSPSKSESADDIFVGSVKTGLTSSSRRSRGKLTKTDVEEWRSDSYPQRQHSLTRSSSASPHPLPLPELQLLLPRETKLVSHNVPLPSPERTRSLEERKLERGRRRGLDEQLKRLVGKTTRSIERSEFRLTRKSAVKQYAGESSHRSRNTITPNSAPTSPVSSPLSSDISTSDSTTPPSIYNARSAPVALHSSGNAGLSSNYQMPSDKIAVLDDLSHTSITVSSRVHLDSLPGPVLPLPSKISSETPVSWRESNAQANVHTLPLPPGADMTSMPTLASSNSPTSDLTGVTSLPLTPISTPVSGAEQIPIRSQWQKGKLIGRGTFGSVYVASNRETGALCAMKEVDILPEDIKSRECMRQLQQEIRVLSNLKHPNIVQYYGSEIVGDKFYIYLEYVHPGSINKFIHDHGAAITESVVRNFTRHILCGLAYLHSTKTIHRDIKGANLLVDAHGVVKLADFGMAKHLSEEVAILSLKGSPYWLAPELLQPAAPKDASADLALAIDIWSLGCTIIEMIDGKPPWSDCEGPAALFKVLKETPPIPETLSADGKDFLQLCFCRNPADRPTAIKLLDHPFVNCTSSFKEKDSMQIQRPQPCHKFNQVPASFDQNVKKGKLAIR